MFNCKTTFILLACWISCLCHLGAHAQSGNVRIPPPNNDRCLSWSGVSQYRDAESGTEFVEYLPVDLSQQKPDCVPILVTLHGSHGYAKAEMNNWYRYAKERGFAVVALQWYLGDEIYVPPERAYMLIVNRLKALKSKYPALRLSNNMLNGFSRGATYMPAMALYDKQGWRNYFRMFMMNAGSWPEQNPPMYMRRAFDPRDRSSYSGKHFCAYYGDQDEYLDLPRKDGTVIKETIESHGGVFDEFLTLPNGRHGDFVRDPALVNKVLDAWLGNSR